MGPSKDHMIKELQLVHNAMTKVISLKKLNNMTPLLHHLHWFLIKIRITFKVLLLVYKSLGGRDLVSLRDLLLYYKPKCDGLHDPLGVPVTELVTHSDRTFHDVPATAWNKLPKGYMYSQDS